VLETDDYEPALPNLKAVAVRFPNDCWKFDKKTVDGAQRVTASLTPACAPWGEALTKALTTAGFKVAAHQDLVMVEAKQRMAPPAAAQWLNVNALLVVDKVEAAALPLGEAGRAKVSVLASDVNGNPGGPAKLGDRARKAVATLAGDRVRPWGDQAVEAVAEIRVTAMLAGTGTPFWRYARRLTSPEAVPPGFKMLLRGSGGRWVPVLPEGVAPTGEMQPDPRQQELAEWRKDHPLSTGVTLPARPAANLPALIDELSAELASRLASGT
jgi:hypothetical protein